MPELQEVPLGEKEFEDYRKARTSAPPAADGEPSKEETKSSAAPEKAAKPESDSETDDESEPQKSKGKGGFQRKIDKLTERNRELQRLLDERQPLAKPAVQEPKNEKPVPGSFKSDEEYLEALVDWRAEQKWAQKVAEETQRAEKEHTQQVFNAYKKSADAFAEEHEDFNEVLGDAEIPQGIGLAIIELNRPDIAYHLGQHPEVREELENMSPHAAIAEIGRIAAQLLPKEKEVRPKDKPESKRPEPIEPVGARSTKSSVPIGEMDFDTYRKARKAGRQI